MPDRDGFMADVKRPEPDGQWATADQCPECGNLWTGHGMDPPPHCGHPLDRYVPVRVTTVGSSSPERSGWESELVTFDRIGAGEAFHVVLDDGTEIAAPMKELVRVMGPDAPGLYGTEAA